MAENWQAGDIAVCVSLRHPNFDECSPLLRKGRPYTVIAAHASNDPRALLGEAVLILKECDTRHMRKGFPSSLFIKVTPSPEVIEQERREQVPA